MTCRSYRVPPSQKAGDLGLFLLRILGYTLALALPFLAAAWLVWRHAFVPERPLPSPPLQVLLPAIVGAVAPAFLLAVTVARASLRWGVDVEEGGLVLRWAYGPSRRLLFDDVVFLRLGSVSEEVRVVGARPRVTPVLIEDRLHRKFRICLREHEAGDLFAGLRERCAHAAAIDRNGDAYPPRVDAGRTAGRRLARERLVWGGGALAMGTLLLSAVFLAPGPMARSDGPLAAARIEMMRVLGLLQGAAFLGYGLKTFLGGGFRRPSERAREEGLRNRDDERSRGRVSGDARMKGD